MMSIHGPGWLHEDDESGEPHETPHGALMSYLEFQRGSCEDDGEDREIACLHKTTHWVHRYQARVLRDEQHRDDELTGLDDEEPLLECPIGGTFYRSIESRSYFIDVQQDMVNPAQGSLTIQYRSAQVKITG